LPELVYAFCGPLGCEPHPSMKRGNAKPTAPKPRLVCRQLDTPLVDLVRLLARQAARDWAEPARGTEPPQTSSIAEEARK